MQERGGKSAQSGEAPSVAVVIAALNVEKYIARAIESAQGQTIPPSEIIVVDDHSTDKTWEVVEAFAEKDKRISLLRSSVRGGPGVARNRALDAATAEWIAILDADDMWKPQRLQRLLDTAGDTAAVVVADNYLMLDDAADEVVGAAFYEPRPQSDLTVERFVESERPMGQVRFGLLKPMVRRAFLQDHGIRYATDIRLAEDFHFFVQILLQGGKAVLLNEPMYVYTLPHSLSSNARSRGSRTRSNLKDRIWVADDLLDKSGATVSSKTTGLLRKYRRWMCEIARGQEMLEEFRNGHVDAAAMMAIRWPRSAFTYAWTSPTLKRLRSRIQQGTARAPS